MRRGYRLARRLEGDLVGLHVHTPTSPTGREALLIDVFNLVRSLGGEVVELRADSVGDEIIRYVNEHKTSMVVMGQSTSTRFEEIVRGSLVTRLMRETKDIDIVVVADSDESP